MYGDNARLLFADTDSLAYKIQTEDFYKDITPHIQEKFDSPNYPGDHPSVIPVGISSKISSWGINNIWTQRNPTSVSGPVNVSSSGIQSKFEEYVFEVWSRDPPLDLQLQS